MRSLKINRLLPIYISMLPLKFGVDIQSQTKVSPETKKSNMATRRPFWKWRLWKSIGSYPYIQVLCHLSLELIFKVKLKLESGNQTRTTRTPSFWGYPPPPHDYPDYRLLSHVGSQLKTRSNDLEDIGQGQRSSHATHLLMLVIICTKYGNNPSRTVDATEGTRFS